MKMRRNFYNKQILQNIKSYLEKLIKLKFSLIDKYYPKPIFRMERPNEEIIKLKEEVEQELSSGKSDKLK